MYFFVPLFFRLFFTKRAVKAEALADEHKLDECQWDKNNQFFCWASKKKRICFVNERKTANEEENKKMKERRKRKKFNFINELLRKRARLQYHFCLRVCSIRKSRVCRYVDVDFHLSATSKCDKNNFM